MASRLYLVKLFSSCFAMNEDSVFHERNGRAHSLSRELYTDAFSSFADCDSVTLASASTSTVYCSGDECDWNTVASSSTLCTNRRDLREIDVRPNRSKRLREYLRSTSTVVGQIVRPNQRKRLREQLCNTLTVTDQEASFFANLTANKSEEPRRKRHHVWRPPSDELSDQRRDMRISGHGARHTVVKKSQELVSRRTRTACALLRKELNHAQSLLNITQARCELLQEENQWLRCNMPDEENSLLRYEVEQLIAKKSQLAMDKANLIRERERLLQLVEYLQSGFPSDEDE